MITAPAAADTSRIRSYCDADWAGDRQKVDNWLYLFCQQFTDMLGKQQTIIYSTIIHRIQIHCTVRSNQDRQMVKDAKPRASPLLRHSDRECSGDHGGQPSIIKLEGRDGPIAPIYCTQYPLPKASAQAVHDTVEGWLKKGYMVDADPGSPWNFPLTVAAKKDLLGNKVDIRVCLDSRALNAKLKEFKYPVPRIMQMYEQVAGHDFYSSIDLRDAYMQWALHSDDQDKLVFTHGKRRLRSVRAMFGLAPMTSYYQHGMDIILTSCASFALSYIDDIVVFSHSLADHIVHLQKVLHLLTKIGLCVNKDKCQLFRSSMILLGFMISNEGSWPETHKLECLWDWPRPCCGKEIQRFLGFVNYFRRYVPLMSKLAAPLDKLRHERNITDKWGNAEQASFDQLRGSNLQCTHAMLS
jgi:hypothetical protein